MHAINFLTAVSRSVHYKLFEGADTLRQICESIVIPNLRMREDMVRALATASQAAMRCVCGGQEACVLPYRAATGHIRMCRVAQQAFSTSIPLRLPLFLPQTPAGGDV